MDLGLTGKNALICGASKGMGRAIAEQLADESANVFLCSRSAEELAETAKAISAKGKSQVGFSSCDLSSKDSRNALINQVNDKFGHVDILVHNSGGPSPTPAEMTSAEQWQSGFELLFQSLVHLTQAFVPGMKERKWGRIITVTSLSVMEPIAGLAVSNGIRSAVTAMLKTLSDEVAQYNITVNCVAPGSISTGRIEELLENRCAKSGKSREQYMSEYLAAIPAGRMGTPEEFANVVCFLASERASYVTGSTISIDGGRRRSTY